ncbi:MAG: TPM domain-containing protein [Muribaculaceae bacterium]|nr:TPM domain-containing protein [Muribaculaceae bacterium]MDE6609557.1 TPM domain-containing protein [Muribaculaceae bacterium]
MKTRLIFLIGLMLTVVAPVVAGVYDVESIPNVHVADRTRFLSNPDGVISPAAQQFADSIMSDIWRKTSAEVVAVVVEDIGDDTDPDTFATELFEKWGIGKKDKDNGLLLFVAVNQRAAVLRTGYGMEGIVPDITGGKILRHDLFPRFREGDYDGGVIAALSTLNKIITDPEARDELMSVYGNDAGAGRSDGEEMWKAYLGFSIVTGGLLLIAVLVILAGRKEPQRKYENLGKMKLMTAVATPLCLFAPLPALLLLLWQMKRLRHKAPRCPRCRTRMRRATDEEDRRWLTDGQRTERRIRSVEHDVWVCPACAYGLVRSYINLSTPYRKCNYCGAIASHLVSDTVHRAPTYSMNGEGVRLYRCENCGHDTPERYIIPRRQRPVVIVGGIGGRGGGFGGGGFSGGSFGGGMTGGGGASGRW